MAINGLCLLQLLERFVLENPPPRLSADFLKNSDTLFTARELLGKLIWSKRTGTTETSASDDGLDVERNDGVDMLNCNQLDKSGDECVQALKITRRPRKKLQEPQNKNSGSLHVKEETEDMENEVRVEQGKRERDPKERPQKFGKHLRAESDFGGGGCSLAECNGDERSVTTVCRMTEVEAYLAPGDKASHAYNNKRTARSATMYNDGGVAYVYLCYGIHSMLNIVTNAQDVPHAVLVRAGMPVAGIQHMQKRRNVPKEALLNHQTWPAIDENNTQRKQEERLLKSLYGIARGPGCLTQCLGISSEDNGVDLVNGDRLWITEAPDLKAFVDFACREIIIMRSRKIDTIIMEHVKIEEMALGAESVDGNSGILTKDDNDGGDDVKVCVLRVLQEKLHLFDQETTRLIVQSSPRIGVDFAGEDAKLLYRFFINDDPSVTKIIGTKKIFGTRKIIGTGKATRAQNKDKGSKIKVKAQRGARTGMDRKRKTDLSNTEDETQRESPLKRSHRTK